MGSSRDIDLAFLNQAHRLAVQGWGRTFPNPMVGAVVVNNGVAVGEGYHHEWGGSHAEVEALNAAGAASRGATLYVTLEPCAHTGQQPPCTEAIVAGGISRVVASIADPNPEAAGGAGRLRAAGIAVDIGVAGDMSPGYNFRFLHRFSDAKRPFVAVKLAVTMDGMIADHAGRSQWISGEAARRWVQWLRAGFAAVAVGARTALADNTRLTVRGPTIPRVAPTRVVFDRSASLGIEHTMFAEIGTAPLTVVLDSNAPESHRSDLSSAGATVVIADTLADALARLGDAGIDSILVEGGGTLAGALLDEGLVDRVYQVQSPRWLSGGVPAWPGALSFDLQDSARWQVRDVTTLAGDDGASDVVIELEP